MFTSDTDEYVLRKVHILMDTTLVSYSWIIVNKTVDGIVFTGGTICNSGAGDEKKDSMEATQPRGGGSFFQVPRECGVEACPVEINILRKIRTDFDGRDMTVNCSMSKLEDITEQYLVRYRKGSKIPAGSTYSCHGTMFGRKVYIVRFAKKLLGTIPSWIQMTPISCECLKNKSLSALLFPLM